MSRTPQWWRSLPVTVQLLLLVVCLPGTLLHELTHGIAAGRFADVSYSWKDIAVEFQWRGTETGRRRAFAHLAPTVVGWTLGVIGLLLIGGGYVTVSASLPAVAYVSVNYLLYVTPTGMDLSGLRFLSGRSRQSVTQSDW